MSKSRFDHHPISLPMTQLAIFAGPRDQPRVEIPGRIVFARRAAAAADDFELLIYGDIGESWWGESITAASIATQIREAQAKSILVRINSYGGSVTDGTAIYNALRASGATITTRIDGIAASIASLIAMAGDTVQMSSNTLLMTHAPWAGVMGNAKELREAADILDTFAKAMATSYARKTGRSVDDELTALTDGEDHWFTAAAAIEQGYADELLDTEEPEEASARARDEIVALALTRFRSAPAAIAAGVRERIPNLFRNPAAAAANHPAPPRASRKQESRMDWKALAKALNISVAADATDVQARDAIAQHFALSKDCSDDDIAKKLVQANHASQPPPGAAGALNPTAAARTGEIEQIFTIAARSRPNDAQLTNLQTRALLDVERPVAEIRQEVLALLGNEAQPVAGRHAVVSAGEDARDKRRTAMSQAVLARIGIGNVDRANEFRGWDLIGVAEACLIDAGVQTSRMNKMEIAKAALGKSGAVRAAGPLTTSDFPVVLERTIESIVLTGFNAQPSTWQQFCRIGDVPDFREYRRLIPAVIGTLDDVNEAGEYKNKALPDLDGNTVKVKRHGNIINVTPELLINDDLGYIRGLADGLGRTGNRSIERAVYALLNSNPTLKDGNALFSVAHKNLGTAAAPSVASIDAARIAMSLQTAPGDVADEYLDLVPKLALVYTGIAGDFRVIISSQYDPDASNKLQRGNKVYNAVESVVATPRLPQSNWYLFADPDVAPVIEVVFLNGQRAPEVTQDDDFRTSGIAWKVELPFGAGAIDYRGGYLNPYVAS